MKRATLLCCLVANLAAVVEARTTLYGEANAFTQLDFLEDSTLTTVTGVLTELGFRGEQEVSDTMNASFYLTLVNDPMAFGAYFAEAAEVMLEGEFGRAGFFAGSTPLSATNAYLQLINDDWWFTDQAYAAAQSYDLDVPVGRGFVDGLAYQSPSVSEALTFDAAYIPSEEVGGEAGVSLAAHYRVETIRVSGAFDINAEIADTQVFRIIGEVDVNDTTAGGGVQVASNSANDVLVNNYLLFVKMPLLLNELTSDIRVLIAVNRLTDAADEDFNVIYLNYLQNFPLAEKVHVYGYAQYLSDDTSGGSVNTLSLGGGLRVLF